MLTLEEIKAFTGVKIGSIRTALKYMLSQHMIEQRASTRGTVKFVLMYDKYQNPKNYDSSSASSEPAPERAGSEQSTRHLIVKNKEKRRKEERTITPPTPSRGERVVSVLPEPLDGHPKKGSRSKKTNPRSLGTNPRSKNTNPRAVAVQEEQIDQWLEIIKPLTPFQLVMQPFYKIYKESLDYGGKGKRNLNLDASNRMIKKYGLEQTIMMVEQAIEWSNTVPYASAIVDPATMETNISKIKRYYETKGNNTQKKVFDLDKKTI